jgi:hypothetical protein
LFLAKVGSSFRLSGCVLAGRGDRNFSVAPPELDFLLLFPRRAPLRGWLNGCGRHTV